MTIHFLLYWHVSDLKTFMFCSFITRDGIIYLTIAEKQYNLKLVFVFLQEVAECFKDELRNTYGSANNIDYLSKIENIDNQYAFLKFGKSTIFLHSILVY